MEVNATKTDNFNIKFVNGETILSINADSINTKFIKRRIKSSAKPAEKLF